MSWQIKSKGPATLISEMLPIEATANYDNTSKIAAGPISDDTYQVTIPGFLAGTTIYFYTEAQTADSADDRFLDELPYDKLDDDQSRGRSDPEGTLDKINQSPGEPNF